MVTLIEACESRRLMSHTLTTAQRAAINELGTELVAFHTAHKVPEATVKAVYNDLLQCIKLAHTPNATVAKKAISDATTAVRDNVVNLKERSLLAADVTDVLYTAKVSKTLARASGTDVNALFHRSAITSADVENVFGTLVAIGESFK